MTLIPRLWSALLLGLLAGIASSATVLASPPPAIEGQAKIKQTLCPVMGGEIDSSIYTDIQGQRVYHCCGMCSDRLKADPDRYFEKSAAEGVLFQNIQTTCPISNEDLEGKTVFVDYKGRRIYFCCEGCVPKFEKDPDGVLQRMDESTGSTDGDAQESGGMMQMHDTHKH